MKNLVISVTCIISLVISQLIFGATWTSMNKSQFEKAFVNETRTSVKVDAYFSGKAVPMSNSIYFNDKGQVFGSMEYKPKRNLPQKDQGTYFVKKDGTVYIRFDHWDFAKQFCFNVFATRNAYIIVDCSDIYHSTFLKANVKDGDHIY